MSKLQDAATKLDEIMDRCHEACDSACGCPVCEAADLAEQALSDLKEVWSELIDADERLAEVVPRPGAYSKRRLL